LRVSVVISSSGGLEMGDLEADTLTVDISSSGDIRMGALHANTLEVDINSSGNLDIASGKCCRPTAADVVQAAVAVSRGRFGGHSPIHRSA